MKSRIALALCFLLALCGLASPVAPLAAYSAPAFAGAFVTHLKPIAGVPLFKTVVYVGADGLGHRRKVRNMAAYGTATDVTSAAATAFSSSGYYHPTVTPYQVSNLVVPAGATFDGSGCEGHVPTTATYGMSLNGNDSKARDVHLICDVPTNYQSPNINPANFSGFATIGISCTAPGVRVNDCKLENFWIGIQSTGSTTVGPDVETQCIGNQIIRPFNIGIDWQTPSDCFVERCIVEQDIGGVGLTGGSGTPAVGIKFYGGAGYVKDCHVWGNFLCDMECGSVGAIIRDNTLEGASTCNLRLTAFHIRVLGGYVYFPQKAGGNASDYAVEMGASGAEAKGCVVNLTIGNTHNTDYLAMIHHVNDAEGNLYIFDYFGGPGSGYVLPVGLGLDFIVINYDTNK